MYSGPQREANFAMLRYLLPVVRLADLGAMLIVALCGIVAAGLYGALHDQVTYSISPEYYTNLKFDQFHYADFGLGNRVFVATIGFLATWWVGGMAGWLLGRWYIPGNTRAQAWRQIVRAIICMTLICFAFGLGAYCYGLYRGPDADYSRWNAAFAYLRITDQWAFVRVAYIHNAGYLGGLVGLIVSLLVVRRSPSRGASVGR